uniref:LRRCT domain-containing protein n=1 Tax=Parastrongyloides trichosuri TaxID=131310 RepID=A0A0N5A498_PARTI
MKIITNKSTSKWFLTILIIAVAFNGVSAQCPAVSSPCRCAPSIYEPVAIICEKAGSLSNVINAIQQAKSVPIDSLTIVDTAITNIPSNVFTDFTILRLVMNRNTLETIQNGAFNGNMLDSLVELDLSDNNLRQVPQQGLTELRALRKIYLNRNRISTLSSTAFDNYVSRDKLLKLELAGNRLTNAAFMNSNVLRSLTSLTELSLETNSLTQIPSYALAGCRETLINLNLGLNQINQVPVGALDFPKLTSLSLEFNGIVTIIPQAFQGVPILQYLYLTGNKFPTWNPEMFFYIRQLRTLGIGETPISIIPEDAFKYTPNLIRLEMSEAAVYQIDQGAFQRTKLIQAIIMNRNRLNEVRSDYFTGLNDLYSIDLQNNRIERVDDAAFANLPSIRHLDISYNLIQTMPTNTFTNSFAPEPNDRRVIYACANPWLCDSRLEWFRQLLRTNADIDIDKPGCVAQCITPTSNGCPPVGTKLRDIDNCPIADNPLPLSGSALNMVGWIILAVVLTILLISICLMALIRYGMSHRRKKQKDQEIEENQFVSSGASVYQTSMVNGGGPIQPQQSHHYAQSVVDLDLPPAYNLDNSPTKYMY